MLRPAASRRRVLELALPLALGTGIGLAAPALWSASAGATSPSSQIAESSTPLGRTPLTLTDAIGATAQAAPGRVIEAKEDNEATGPTYDVTVVHADGLVSELEVDAATGQILTRKLKD